MYAQLIYSTYWLNNDNLLLSELYPNICVTPYFGYFTAHRLYRILNIKKIEKH